MSKFYSETNIYAKHMQIMFMNVDEANGKN